jgi:hypothetical protein
MKEELSTKVGVFESGDNDAFGVAYKDNRLLRCRNNKLTEYTVAEGTEIICDRAFHDCKALESILLPDSIKAIGEAAFSGCRNLREINIPEGVAVIRQGTFRDTDSLADLALPESVTQIEKFALGSGLTTLGCEAPEIDFNRSALQYCNRLATVFVPESSLENYLLQLSKLGCKAAVETIPVKAEPASSESTSANGSMRKMKTIYIGVYGIERFLDLLDEEGDGYEAFGQFTSEDELTFTVGDDEYTQYDFADLDDLPYDDQFSPDQELDVEKICKEYGATSGMLYTNKSSCTIEIELPEDEEFDPKKAALVCRDWIYPDETDESMVKGLVYVDKLYEFWPEDSRGIEGHQIWPLDEGKEDDWDED